MKHLQLQTCLLEKEKLFNLHLLPCEHLYRHYWWLITMLVQLILLSMRIKDKHQQKYFFFTTWQPKCYSSKLVLLAYELISSWLWIAGVIQFYFQSVWYIHGGYESLLWTRNKEAGVPLKRQERRSLRRLWKQQLLNKTWMVWAPFCSPRRGSCLNILVKTR